MTWPTVELGDVADVVMGQSPPGETYNEDGEGLPFFQGKADFGEQFPEVRKWCTAPRKVAEHGDILLSVRAPVGPTNVARERSCIGRGLAAIRGNPDLVDQAYLRLYLRHREHTLAARGQGSTFLAIGRGDIEALDLPLPDLAEQRRIVKSLHQAEDLRRLRARADAIHKRLLPAMFVKSFGDPVTNPKGWTIRTIGDLCQVVSGATPRTNREEYWGGSIAWATPKDVSNLDDWVLRRTTRTITEAGFASCSTTMLPEGSVLFSSRAPIGLVAISGIPVCTNQGFKSFVCGPDIDPWYLFAWCKLRTRFLQSLGHGATFKEVSKRIMEAVQIPLPPASAQVRFRARMEQVHEVRHQALCAGGRTSFLFSQLLAGAFSGSLDVSGRGVETKGGGPTSTTGEGPSEVPMSRPEETKVGSSLRTPSVPFDERELDPAVGLRTPRMDPFLQVERALRSMRSWRADFEVTRELRASVSAVLDLPNLDEAVRRLSAASLNDVLRTSKEDLASARSNWAHIRSSVQLSADHAADLGRTLELSARNARAATRILAEIDPGALVARLDSEMRLASRAWRSLHVLASGFDRLTATAGSALAFRDLPSFALPGASREVVVSGNALRALASSEDDAEEEESECLTDLREETASVGDLLGEADPALAEMYRGAKAALSGRNADRIRHVLVSLRELWSHLLRILAPDEEMLPWLVDQGGELSHNGRPTKRARLLYLCRGYQHQPLTDFVESDAKAFTGYLDLLNRLHRPEPGFSESQLRALVLRTDSWLLFLLQISRESRRC